MTISKRQIARQLGVDEKAIRKAITSGRFRKCLGQENGRTVIVDADMAATEWTENAARPPKGADQPKRTQSAPESAPADQGVAPSQEPTTLLAINREIGSERARKLKLENDKRQGRLVELEIVTREAFNAQRAVREAVLNVPSRVAGELAAETDPAKVAITLEAALREALQAAAMTIRQAAANE